MASYGELVLVVGDFHIPHRAADVHEQFKKLLGPNKIQHVLCTGNLCTKDQVDYLRSLAPRVHIVRGDFDDDESYPEHKVVSIGAFRIGLMHGHQVAPVGETEALAAVQRTLDVDVLVTGHTHQSSILEYDGKAYVNPGSITGAYSPSASGLGEVKPSFMLMNITDARIEFFLYELLPGDKLKISRSMFSKGGAAGAAAAGAAGASAGGGGKHGAAATGSTE